MEKEKVTILMATHNGVPYLKRQLKSIKEQDYKDWKLIVGDDASEDGTLLILSELKRELKDKVEIIKNYPPTGSAKANFMGLLSRADTPYIMFCDQDDIWKRDKISRTLKCMEKYENQRFSYPACAGRHASHATKTEKNPHVPVLVHSDLKVFGKEGIISGSFFKYQNLPARVSLPSLMVQNSVTGCTVMINKELRDRMLMAAPKDNKIIMHDYFAALIAAVYGRIGFVDEPTIFYRQHGGNSVGAKNNKSPSYLWKRFLQGRDDYKQQMEKSRAQVRFFLETYSSLYPIRKDKEALMGEYAFLGGKNKIYRIIFYTRNKVLKKGLIRVVMQYIWG